MNYTIKDITVEELFATATKNIPVFEIVTDKCVKEFYLSKLIVDNNLNTMRYLLKPDEGLSIAIGMCDIIVEFISLSDNKTKEERYGGFAVEETSGKYTIYITPKGEL